MELYNEESPIEQISINSILTNTFFRMFLGLIASAITAFYALYSGAYYNIIMSGGYYYLALAEIAVVFVFSLLFRKLSPTMVTILYFAYAFLNGFTLSILFVAYTLSSICYAFVGTALLFGILAFIGYKTDKDLSNWRTILLVSLITGLILTIFNILIGSTILSTILDWVILFIFFGLTIYDTNKIKLMHEQGFCDEDKLYIYGAMELYLDFINIFLRILSLFGKRKK